jgi:hypothetical protein
MPCVDPDFPTKCPGFCRRFGKLHINDLNAGWCPTFGSNTTLKAAGPEAEKLNRSDETFNLAFISFQKLKINDISGPLGRNANALGRGRNQLHWSMSQ